MKTLLIAEKPSVAKVYAQMLAEIENQHFKTANGFLESEQYYVSWCYGHLVENEEPAAYGWVDWDIEDLPMLPEKWKYRVKNDSGAKKQFEVLKTLVDASSVVINGADAGREGELIYRLVMLKAAATKIEQKRLWTSSFVMKDLKKAWENLKPLSLYNNLFASAILRSKSDWLVGMNFSRAYSLATGVHGLSVGRVQTPTLNLIVERDLEIENWRDKFYYQLELNAFGFNFVFKDDQGTYKFEKKDELIPLKNELLNQEGTITKCQKDEKTSSPPKPFNLSKLQQEANNKLGFTAQKTLDICQSLYEAKLVTYPRTDSEYLPKNMKEEAYQTLEVLTSELNIDKSLVYQNQEDLPFFNDKKVSDHFAIIPTGHHSGAPSGRFSNEPSEQPNSLPSEEHDKSLNQDQIHLLDLIVKRFITAFGIKEIYNETKLELNVANSLFHASSIEVINLGYKALFTNNSTIENKSENPKLISEGDKQIIKDIEVVEKKETKPKYFTEATLLKAMELSGKKLEDKELTEAMKENGLGTPATRAATIETLKYRKYVQMDKKQIKSTQKGRSLISIVDPKLKSPILTGEWEKELALIENGEGDWKKNIADTEIYIKELVENIKTAQEQGHYENFKEESGVELPLLKCPKCKNVSIKQHPKGNFCQTKDPDCGFVLWNTVFGKVLTAKQKVSLLTTGKTKKIKGFSYKDKKFDGALEFDNDFKLVLQKKDYSSVEVNCPKCNSLMKFNNGGAFCECGQKIFRKNFGKVLTDKILIDLIKTKQTEVLSFKGSKGPYKAKLILIEDFETEFFKSKLKFD